MEGEQKFIIIVVSIAVICVTVLYGILFFSLWAYRQYVGLSLFGLLIASGIVFLRGKLTEQNLRMMRYRHLEETPLDDNGEPRYYHQNWQPNPHRR